MTRTTFSAYRLEKLSAYVSVQPGYAFASEKFTDDPSDCPLVKGENVQQGYVDWGAAKYWPQSEIDDFAAYELRAGDVVVAMDRPWVQAGLKWAYIRKDDPRSLLVQRVARLTARDGLDQTYLRCLISSAYFAAYVQPIVTGVNVPHISGKQIGDFLIPVPDLPVQRNIAAILSAYDDLIANNQRRIALLEGMAEEIYREWFVRMRFPGYAGARYVAGLPEGWTQRRLSEVADINARSVNRQSEPEFIRYIDISAVGTNQLEMPEEIPFADAPGRARRVVRSGDILWSSVRPGNKAYCVVVRAMKNLVASTGFAVISPRLDTPYTYLHLATTTQNFVDQMVAVAKGSAYPAAAFDDFGRALIIWPTESLLARFHAVCEPIYEQLDRLRSVNRQLASQRDALLPRLISGKLKVDHLDIRLPPGMWAEAEAVA